MKRFLYFIFVTILLFLLSFIDCIAQNTREYVNINKIGIGDTSTWYNRYMYLDVYGYLKSDDQSSVDIQQFNHPIFNDAVSFIVRKNTQFQFESVYFKGICYIGELEFHRSPDNNIFWSRRYFIDEDCYQFNAVTHTIKEYIEHISSANNPTPLEDI